VVGIDEKMGWWLAPDGSWYPPELHPGHGAGAGGGGGGGGQGGSVATCIRPMGPGSRFERLYSGGRCVNCAAPIRPLDEGWSDPDGNQMICATCWPALVVSGRSAPAAPTAATSTAATSTAATGSPTAPPAIDAAASEPGRRPGAVGEYLVSIRLHRDLGDRAVVLSHRRVPGSPTTIANVVVAPSGVWAIEAKKTRGLVEYRAIAGREGEDGRLLIGGHDRTGMIERVLEHVARVAGVVADPGVPVHGALAIVEGNWGGPARILGRRPCGHRGVWVLWPAALLHKVGAPGPLSADRVLALGATLDRALPPR